MWHANTKYACESSLNFKRWVCLPGSCPCGDWRHALPFLMLPFQSLSKSDLLSDSIPIFLFVYPWSNSPPSIFLVSSDLPHESSPRKKRETLLRNLASCCSAAVSHRRFAADLIPSWPHPFFFSFDECLPNPSNTWSLRCLALLCHEIIPLVRHNPEFPNPYFLLGGFFDSSVCRGSQPGRTHSIDFLQHLFPSILHERRLRADVVE
jgi:hypothetical protein